MAELLSLTLSVLMIVMKWSHAMVPHHLVLSTMGVEECETIGTCMRNAEHDLQLNVTYGLMGRDTIPVSLDQIES
jgi:hypothetical protein